MSIDPWLYGADLQSSSRGRRKSASQSLLRALALIVILAAIFVGGMVLIDLRYSSEVRTAPAPLASFWPEGTYESPQSYEVWGSDGSYSAAELPGKWRYDVAGSVQQLGDGRYLWDTRGPGMYWAIPYASSVAAGDVTEVPRLQDGRPITVSDNAPSTRMAVGALGPTSPEQLMQIIESAQRSGGEWALSSSQFLGRDVTVLEVQGTNLANHHSVGGPFSTTLWIDDEYLFVLKSESSGVAGEFSIEALRVQFDSHIDQSVFEFVPPSGYKQCLPPQFANRGIDC